MKTDKELRAWIFNGTNEIKFPIRIYIESTDRENAIINFESDYPQYNWFVTEECQILSTTKNK